MGCGKMSKLLDNINSPEDMKKLSSDALGEVCEEIREFLVDNVSKTGGHLASSLGVVELTVAMHKVFDLPEDKIVWDVGHQSYVHKILTGRRKDFPTLRQYGGLSGFPKTKESKYDCFNTGHSSTSLSAALGMAHARDLDGEDYNVLAVFGDGAFTGGMLYEAINNAGHSKQKLILILNDNEMSISNNVGAVSKYLCRLRTKKGYHRSKDYIAKKIAKLPRGGKGLHDKIVRVKNRLKRVFLPSNFFADLGFNYLGPIDGHDLNALINIFEVAKLNRDPVFIHVKTKKGKGYKFAEENPQKFHGIAPFDKETGEILKRQQSHDYSSYFGETITKLAKYNKKIVAITGAMSGGTGLDCFLKAYPERFFDVGIAEQHAVTMGAGMAISGYVPIIPIYSSFLQRAYDQIMHDVCLQNLHVVFCIDRAGIVGADGETHHGLYDIGYMSQMPNMSILSPSSLGEFGEMLDYAVNRHNGPICIRYPRGGEETDNGRFEFARGKLLAKGRKVTIITAGRMISRSAEVYELLKNDGINANVIVMPTIKPIDTEMILSHISQLTVVIEDHSEESGLGCIVAKTLAENGVITKLKIFGFPNEPIVHGRVDELDRHYGLDAESIYKKIKENI